jgi:hypothetical protein
MVNRLRHIKLKEVSLVDFPANKAAMITITKKEQDDMTTKDTFTKKEHDDAVEAAIKVEADKAVALQKQLDDAKNELAKARMSADERSYMDGLTDEDAKKKFMGLSPEDRKKKMGSKVKKVEDDEVIKVGDLTITKSAVGDAQFSIFKGMAAQIEASALLVAKANETAERALISKRVETEFKHVAGTPEEKTRLLSAMKGQPKEVTDVFEKVMKSADDLAKGAFTRLGSQGGEIPIEIAKAKTTFNTKVSEIMKRDKITRLKAMQKARTENPDLVEAMQAADEESDRDAA